LGCHDKELSVLFTDDRRMAALNRRYTGREGPTNVLAFPMVNACASMDQTPDVQTGLLGDVVISLDTAKKEAKELEETLDQTVDRLLIHGTLHLMGYDHVGTEEEASRMEREEERLTTLIEKEEGIWHG